MQKPKPTRSNDPEAPFIEALRKRFPPSSYTLLTQVSIPAPHGFRVIDAIVLGRWVSRDLDIHGFEIKTTRANWLSEFNHPEKADPGASICNTWSLFAYPGVADPHEIPPLWGHLVLDDGSLQTKKEAPSASSKPLDRAFVIKFIDAALEQAQCNLPVISNEVEYTRGLEDGKKRGYSDADLAHGYLTHRVLRSEVELERLQGALRALNLDGMSDGELKDISEIAVFYKNLRFYRRPIKDILRAIDLLSSHHPKDLRSSLEDLYHQATRIRDDIEMRLDSIKNLFPTEGLPEHGQKEKVSNDPVTLSTSEPETDGQP
jgi:hypothetical protein